MKEIKQLVIDGVSPPPLVTVPNVVGLTSANARNALTSANLTVGVESTASSTSVPAGSIISQEPPAGTPVAAGTAVSFVTSSGPPVTPPSGSTPYGGTAVTLPGTVQAENFDEGGAAVAYRDVTPGNSGGVYRATDVDIEATMDPGGGYNVGWIDPGEWLEYSVTVAAAGSYRLDLRVAAYGAGGRVHVEFDGVDKTGPLMIPDTGGWQNWTTISAPVALAAGAQRMRVNVDAFGPSGIVGNLNYVQVMATAPPPAGGDIVIYASDVPAAALHGGWTIANDPTSPNQTKLMTPNDGVAQTERPLASPTHYFDVPFEPVADTPYTVWVRLKALDDSKYNDAVWLQFSGARIGGAPAYEINTTSGLLVNLATDSAVTASGTGDGKMAAYWLSQPATVTFAAGGTQPLRVQVREDGVQLDQIVMSRVSTSPGSHTDDATIVQKP